MTEKPPSRARALADALDTLMHEIDIEEGFPTPDFIEKFEALRDHAEAVERRVKSLDAENASMTKAYMMRWQQVERLEQENARLRKWKEAHEVVIENRDRTQAALQRELDDTTARADANESHWKKASLYSQSIEREKVKLQAQLDEARRDVSFFKRYAHDYCCDCQWDDGVQMHKDERCVRMQAHKEGALRNGGE